MCSDRCICRDQDCAIRSNTTALEGDPSPPCQSRSCEVCDAFKTQPLNIYTNTLESKNARLNQLLRCCKAVNALYHLAKYAGSASLEEAGHRKKEVQNVLCKLVLCSENRLNCMKNIGEMAEEVPGVLCVQLKSGHSEFWTELRKVAKAINKQATLECKLAALIVIRKSIPPSNLWASYLTSSHQQEEMNILSKWTSSMKAALGT